MEVLEKFGEEAAWENCGLYFSKDGSGYIYFFFLLFLLSFFFFSSFFLSLPHSLSSQSP